MKLWIGADINADVASYQIHGHAGGMVWRVMQEEENWLLIPQGFGAGDETRTRDKRHSRDYNSFARES
ncbi:MAG: hypothetical protein BGO12_04280 [Verrucomicrobia bacterium 61-8]|nr:MAG: hypothetical protein BGO12_04280 [Verrucomicrobia bacterium 61-8]